MTPRGLVAQADEKVEAAAKAAAIDELGPPTGFIVVNENPMAYWLPGAVRAPSAALSGGASDAHTASAQAPGASASAPMCPRAGCWSAPEGATQERPPF